MNMEYKFSSQLYYYALSFPVLNPEGIVDTGRIVEAEITIEKPCDLFLKSSKALDYVVPLKIFGSTRQQIETAKEMIAEYLLIQHNCRICKDGKISARRAKKQTS